MAKPSIIAEIESDFDRLDAARIDPAAFMALPRAERVARWQGWSDAERAELIGEYLLAKYGEIDIEMANVMIAGLNKRAGVKED